MKTSTSTTKTHYCFVGQNATCGTPNAISGRMSMYGDIVAFSSRAKRDHFVAEYTDQCNASVFAAKTNKSSMKADYCAGMNPESFSDYIRCVEMNEDEKYNSYFSSEERLNSKNGL